MKNQRKTRRSVTTFDTGSAYRDNLDRELHARVGHELREMHAGIMAEGVPQIFEELLARLDRANQSRGD